MSKENLLRSYIIIFDTRYPKSTEDDYMPRAYFAQIRKY